MEMDAITAVDAAAAIILSFGSSSYYVAAIMETMVSLEMDAVVETTTPFYGSFSYCAAVAVVAIMAVAAEDAVVTNPSF